MSKQISFKAKDVAKPPKNTSWVWHTADMITTDGWRKLSLLARRFIERLEVEHMAHKGQENGRLMVSYNQFVQWGISRRYISNVIKEVVAAGFVRVEEGGWRLKETPNKYRLTYFHTRTRTITGAYEHHAPTNEWKRLAGKSFFEATKCELTKATKCELTEPLEKPKTAEILNPGRYQNVA